MSSVASAQFQTVGVDIYKDEAFGGYTFFSPMSNNSAYLIDACGFLVNEWPRNNRPGLSGYLAENGLMLRTNKVNSPKFSQASTGGNLELVDWDNNTVWSADFNTQELIQHHDAKLLPNGNIIFIGWERISTSEQTEYGRNTSILSSPYLWGEFIYEIELNGLHGYSVVWEWHLQDHFIQDFNSSKSNFGNVSQNIGKVDINYLGPGAWDDDDWWHCNAIDYNADLDQILLNSRNNNELWIIDHSTTTAEARGYTGGNTGHGGDLLFRWGNPQAYDHGNGSDLGMYGSHGHYWIPEGLPNAGKIMFFNNGDDRPQGYYSTIEMLAPQMNGFNYVTNNSSGKYLPIASELVYKADNPFDFKSTYLSNARQLENGNVFINEGGTGRLFEVDDNDNIVWQYENPVNSSGPVTQGSFISSNRIFRAYMLPEDYSGFDGQDLTGQFLLEGDSEFNICEGIGTDDINLFDVDLKYLMPSHRLVITQKVVTDLSLTIYDVSGRVVKATISLDEVSVSIDMSELEHGVYIATLNSRKGTKSKKFTKF